VLRETAAVRGLTIGFQHGSADVLPYADRAFDFVLSWHSITGPFVRQVLAFDGLP
jgi:hypothetical protein